jgi:hypothetical protein
MVRFVLEAYEGIAVVTTLDNLKGLIVLAIAPGCEQMVENIMADLGQYFMIEAGHASDQGRIAPTGVSL